MYWQRWRIAVVLLCLCHSVQAGKLSWDHARLDQPPTVTHVPEHDQGNIKAVFYDGPIFQDKPTRVFAYLGMPDIKPHA